MRMNLMPILISKDIFNHRVVYKMRNKKYTIPDPVYLLETAVNSWVLWKGTPYRLNTILIEYLIEKYSLKCHVNPQTHLYAVHFTITKGFKYLYRVLTFFRSNHALFYKQKKL